MPRNRRIIFLLSLIAVVMAGGTAGYMLIEGWSLFESIYMTVITVSTVGFQEIRPLSDAGKLFTVGFIASSIFTVGYTVTTLISYIFEGQIASAMRERKMKKKISSIKNHYIICGFGSVGRETAEEFHRQRIPFIIMEKTPDETEIARFPDYLFFQGDATEEADLEAARIDKAAGLVSCLSDDHQNLFVVLTARQLYPHLQIVSRSTDEKTIEKLKRAGADRVISPQQIAGKRLAAVALQPAIVDFLDVISGDSSDGLRIQAVRIPAGSPLAGKTLRESNIGQHTGAIIIGIMGPTGKTRINASSMATLSSIVLDEGDQLVSLGNLEQVESLKTFCAG